jgi:hypothetical protein
MQCTGGQNHRSFGRYAFLPLVIANVQFYIDGPIDSDILHSNNDRAVFLEGFVLD